MKAKEISIEELELDDEIIFTSDTETWHGIVSKLSKIEENKWMFIRTVKLENTSASFHLTKEDQVWLVHREELLSYKEHKELVKELIWDEEEAKLQRERYRARLELEAREAMTENNGNG